MERLRRVVHLVWRITACATGLCDALRATARVQKSPSRRRFARRTAWSCRSGEPFCAVPVTQITMGGSLVSWNSCWLRDVGRGGNARSIYMYTRRAARASWRLDATMAAQGRRYLPMFQASVGAKTNLFEECQELRVSARVSYFDRGVKTRDERNVKSNVNERILTYVYNASYL